MPTVNRSSNTDPRDVFIRLNPLGLGDARHYVRRIWPATRSQAKYQAYQELAECFNDDATAMLSFKVRAA